MTSTDTEILALERRFYARPGSKETAIAVELGMTSTRYHQRLHQLLDDPAALVGYHCRRSSGGVAFEFGDRVPIPG